MKSSQFIMPLVSGVLGLALGLALAPNVRTKDAKVSERATGRFNHGSTAAPGGTGTAAGTKSAIRTRAGKPEKVPKSSAERISLPLTNVVEILKEERFEHMNFANLDRPMRDALDLLGATEMERDEIMKLLEASKQEILASEKSHLKLGVVTADSITIDMSGMRGPAAAIAGRTQDGIKASLPADIATPLISAIDWESYYPTDEKSFARLEINRGQFNHLFARERHGQVGSGNVVDYKYDGTPLPADEIFDDRWKPFLKGVTILPKDEE